MGLENFQHCLNMGYWPLPTIFAKKVFYSNIERYRKNDENKEKRNDI